jgi:hypothetical protein
MLALLVLNLLEVIDLLCVKPYKQKMPVRDRQFLTHNNQTYEGFDYEKVHENTYFPFLEQT